MSIEISFDVRGADQIRSKFANILGNLPSALDNAVNELGELGLMTAQEMCPVRTGNLRDSIMHSHAFMASVIATFCDYAIWVEFGTWKMGARAFMEPARQAIMAAMQEVGAEKISEVIME